MKAASFRHRLLSRALTNLAAIAAVAAIFGAKAMEHGRYAEETAPQIAMSPAAKG